MEIELKDMYKDKQQNFVNILKDINHFVQTTTDRNRIHENIYRHANKIKDILYESYMKEKDAFTQQQYFNDLYIWQFFLAFYFDKQQSKQQRLFEFFSQIYESDQNNEAIELLQFGKFRDFLHKMDHMKVDHLLEPIKKQITTLVNQRIRFFEGVRQAIDYYDNELNLINKFNQQKIQFLDCLEDLQQLPEIDQKQKIWQKLRDIVLLMSGDIQFIQEITEEDLSFRAYYYIMFIDPFLQQKQLKEFIDYCYKKDRNYFTKSHKNDEPQQLMDCGWFRVIQKILLHPKDPIFAYQECRNVLNQVVYFFLGVLLQNLQGSILEDNSFKNKLLSDYFKTLLSQNENFQSLRTHYEICYDYENNINQDLLKKMITVNIFDSDVITFLNQKQLFPLYETCLDYWIQHQKNKKQITCEQIFFILKHIEKKHIEDQLLLIFFDNNYIDRFNANKEILKVNKEILIQLKQFCQFYNQIQQNSIDTLELYNRIIKNLKNNKNLSTIIEFQYLKLLIKILEDLNSTGEFEIQDADLRFLITLQNNVQMSILINMNSENQKTLDQIEDLIIRLHQFIFQLFDLNIVFNLINIESNSLVYFF